MPSLGLALRRTRSPRRRAPRRRRADGRRSGSGARIDKLVRPRDGHAGRREVLVERHARGRDGLERCAEHGREMCVGPPPVAARTRVGGRVGEPTVAGRVADRLRDCISATRASRSAAAASTRARKDLAAFPPERPARKPSVAKYSSGADGCGNIDAGAVAGRAGHARRGSTGRRGR